MQLGRAGPAAGFQDCTRELIKLVSPSLALDSTVEEAIDTRMEPSRAGLDLVYSPRDLHCELLGSADTAESR